MNGFWLTVTCHLTVITKDTVCLGLDSERRKWKGDDEAQSLEPIVTIENTCFTKWKITPIIYIIIKFGYNTYCHWLKERALWDYRAWNWAKAVTPSAKLYYVRPFPGLLSSFSFVNWKWNFGTSEQRFAKMPGAVIYVTVTWAETKILKDKTKWTVRVLKVFTLS